MTLSVLAVALCRDQMISDVGFIKTLDEFNDSDLNKFNLTVRCRLPDCPLAARRC